MELKISITTEQLSFAKVYLIPDRNSFENTSLTNSETDYLTKKLEENNLVIINRYNELLLFVPVDNSKSRNSFLEQCRKRGNEISELMRMEKISQVDLVVLNVESDVCLALAEGLALGSYQFVKYRSPDSKFSWSLKQINMVTSEITQKQLDQFTTLIEAVFMARDLVNEPASYLNSLKLAENFEEMGKSAGFETEIFHKEKIKDLNMGGLLAVNLGSIDPPTFSVLKWEPADALNKKPIVLIGKGVVYDTGGLSLKPTKDSMDYMKCDMAGGAVVAAVIYFAAKCKLPLNLIALVPSTDNRPDGNAYAPGDVIIMHSGKSVEVMNTDAEGRLLLADALSFAKTYHPELVIDVATLTGSASMAIGHQGIVGMGNAEESIFNELKQSGDNVYERIVEFPLWEEYGESIKSDIADLKNVGGREAGAITAGKFLENFVDYPWIHLDIAGPSYLNKADNYRTKGGTGVGVRLLIDFLNHLV